MTSALLAAALVASAVLVGAHPYRGRAGPATDQLEARLRGYATTLQHKRSASQLRSRCLSVLEAFAAELRAGRPAVAALQRAAVPHPQLLTHTLGAIRLGGDVSDALLADSRRTGQQVLRRLAACWRVGEGTGAGLAAAVTSLAAASRESERIRLELATRTAEPRATMRVLAALPAFGLLLGTGLGADTVGWLVGTAPGRVALALGLLLDAVGVLWSRRLVAGVEAAL